MYAIKIAADGRVLSACVVLEGMDYARMTIVDQLPEGDIADYRYGDGDFVYDPLPRPAPESAPTLESRVEVLETDAAETREALEIILSGVVE